jgi:ribosomal-protein-serine acetyltransferase
MLTVSPEIELRNYREENAEELFALIEVNRSYLRPWLSWIDRTQKVEHSLDFIRSGLQDQHDQKGLFLGIFKNEKLIGGIGMHDWNHEVKRAEIGYWLAKGETGKGILHQCAITFIAFLFEKLQLNKITLHYFPANEKSAAVAKRLGFKVEGWLREQVIFNGQLQDIIINGLLRKEWQQSINDIHIIDVK